MSNNLTIKISGDAYSSGQIESKLWLCRQIEKYSHTGEAQTIWVLGGWVGLLSFLLLSRENLNIKAIRSFDLDPVYENQADVINENWHWQNRKFKAKTIDCNFLDYSDLSFADSDEPSLIINTSVEHFRNEKWYSNIPFGKKLVLQSCNLKHRDHVSCVYSEEEFKKRFQLSDLYYSGTCHFNYPTNSFSRYMLIGRK